MILVAFLTAVGGCGDDSGSSTDSSNGAATYHAESDPLKGFSYDSGKIPAGSPVQLDFKLAAGGNFTLDAASKDAGAGKFALDSKITMTANITSTVPGATYDGPIKGAPDIYIGISGSTTFDPLSIGQMATLTAMLTPSDLINLPLATLFGIPLMDGNLDLKLTGGSVTSTFSGVCTDGGKYSGTVATTGTLNIGGSTRATLN